MGSCRDGGGLLISRERRIESVENRSAMFAREAQCRQPHGRGACPPVKTCFPKAAACGTPRRNRLSQCRSSARGRGLLSARQSYAVPRAGIRRPWRRSRRARRAHHVEYGDGRRAGEVVAAEGCAQQPGARLEMGRDQHAADRKPLPMPLAVVIRSGRMPAAWWAKKCPVRP